MFVIADRAAGTRVEADDASRLELGLPAFVAAVAEVDERRGMSFLFEQRRERNACLPRPLDEDIDRRAFDAFVRLDRGVVVALVPGVGGRGLRAMRARRSGTGTAGTRRRRPGAGGGPGRRSPLS